MKRGKLPTQAMSVLNIAYTERLTALRGASGAAQVAEPFAWGALTEDMAHATRPLASG
jgi:hypothetical protein